MYKVYLAYVHIEHVVVSFAGRVLSFRATWSRRESFINVNDTRTPLLDIHTQKRKKRVAPIYLRRIKRSPGNSKSTQYPRR